MLSFRKTAPLAVLSLTLLSGASFSGAGFALGTSGADTQLASDTIKIDTSVLAADAAAQEAALNPQSSDVVFTPGTGGMIPQQPVVDEETVDPAPIKASSLAELVKSHSGISDLDAETRCLAGAVYFESKGESLAGQLAVARVVLARTKSGRFPSTICGVVYQRSQFSFVRGGKMPAISTGSQHWKNAVAISKIALDGSWKSQVEGALFFHARYVSPGWRLKRMGTIDNHVFYR
jgi:spore germination cell wall hydrolase CwlJ-like protein